jgi:hypothetical protein
LTWMLLSLSMSGISCSDTRSPSEARSAPNAASRRCSRTGIGAGGLVRSPRPLLFSPLCHL